MRPDQALALGGEMVRYGLCSVFALACDMGLLLVLHHHFGMHYLAASAIGFTVGIVAAYLTSVRWAFRARRIADERAEFMAFAMIGLIGLGLTQLLLHLFVQNASLPVAAAKIVTAGFVFMFNFAARKMALFTQAAR